MADDVAKFEFQRMQLAAGLSAVAESMRTCANMAENFATMIKQNRLSVDSPTMQHIQPAGASGQDATSKSRKRKVLGSDDCVQPTKRTRKPKDPNAPKRPASSYIIFQNEIRKELKATHPNISNGELLTMIAKQWAEMSEEDKAIYHSVVASAKEQYSAEKKAYDNRSPEEVAAANAAVAAAAAEKKASRKQRNAKPKPAAPIAEPPKAAQPAPPSVLETTPSVDSSDSDDSDDSDEEDKEDGSDSSEEEQPVPKKGKQYHKVPTPAPRKKITKA